MKNWLFTLSAFICLTGCAASDGGSFASTAGKSVRIDSKNEKNIPANKEVYIGDFRVSFVTQDKGSAKAGSPMLDRSSRATEFAQSILVAKLTDVPHETMQAITDEAYADFTAGLQARGYTILDRSGLEQIHDWKDVDTVSSPQDSASAATLSNLFNKATGASEQESITFAPSGMALVKVSNGLPLPYKYGASAEQAGKPILRAHYTVHFAYFGTETDYRIDYAAVDSVGDNTRTISASTSMGQGIQVIPGAAIEITLDGGGTFTKSGYVALKDPVIVGGAYGENADTTSGTTKAVNAFSSALGVLSGGSSSTKEISVRANPAYYKQGVLKALDESNSRLIQALP